MQNQLTQNYVFNIETEEIDSNEVSNEITVDMFSNRKDIQIITHNNGSTLRQRFESQEQLIHTLVSDTDSVVEEVVMKFCFKEWNVCHFNALPKWLQDNDFIHSGHRPPLPSFWICLKSIFRLHNETINIWTHGLGVIIFLFLAVQYYLSLTESRLWIDRLMVGIYFCGAITCLLFSTIFHTCSCHSRSVLKLFSKLDYCGISVQIFGSMIPALYYGFYYNRNIFLVYISVGFILFMISIVICLWDKFCEPRFRTLRTVVFAAFGLSNIIPAIHWFIRLESDLMTEFYLILLQGLLYAIGAIFYANRIPERYFPGKCDFWFQSHQIFHVLVVLAAIVHWNGITGLAEIRLMPNNPYIN